MAPREDGRNVGADQLKKLLDEHAVLDLTVRQK